MPGSAAPRRLPVSALEHARSEEPGLLSEQVDPTSGTFLGNHPQAFSHVGVISSGINLGRQLARLT